MKNSLHCEVYVHRQEIYCKSNGNNFLINYLDLLGRDVLTMLLVWEKTASGHFYGDRWHKSKRTGLFYLSLHIQKKETELYILYFLDSKTVFPGRFYLKFPHIRSECELGAYSDFFVLQQTLCALLPWVSKWGLISH